MKQPNQPPRLACLLIILFTLSACGGGGGNESVKTVLTPSVAANNAKDYDDITAHMLLVRSMESFADGEVASNTSQKQTSNVQRETTSKVIPTEILALVSSAINTARHSLEVEQKSQTLKERVEIPCRVVLAHSFCTGTFELVSNREISSIDRFHAGDYFGIVVNAVRAYDLNNGQLTTQVLGFDFLTDFIPTTPYNGIVQISKIDQFPTSSSRILTFNFSNLSPIQTGTSDVMISGSMKITSANAPAMDMTFNKWLVEGRRQVNSSLKLSGSALFNPVSTGQFIEYFVTKSDTESTVYRLTGKAGSNATQESINIVEIRDSYGNRTYRGL